MRNPVAKYMNTFNKPLTEESKKRKLLDMVEESEAEGEIEISLEKFNNREGEDNE